MGVIGTSAGGGLGNSKLAAATATPADVTAGKTFYAGDKELKTGTHSASFKNFFTMWDYDEEGHNWADAMETVKVPQGEGNTAKVLIVLTVGGVNGTCNVDIKVKGGKQLVNVSAKSPGYWGNTYLYGPFDIARGSIIQTHMELDYVKSVVVSLIEIA